MAEEQQQINDDRFSWLKVRVMKGLSFKDDKWNQLISNEDVITELITFFESADTMPSLFFFDREGELAMSQVPPNAQKKVLYFTKAQNFAKIEKGKPIPAGVFMYGDLTPDTLGLLNQKMDNVFFPILKQSTKQWPELLQKDISQQCDQFSQQIQIVKGRKDGQYVLPAPTSVEDLLFKLKVIQSGKPHPLEPNLPLCTHGQSVVSVLTSELKEDIMAIEQIVLEWIKQIRHLIHYQPEDVLQQSTPTPHTEIIFWENKQQMTQQLIQTIYKPINQAIFQILKIVGSSYYNALNDSLTQLKEENGRCYSNRQFLQPLKTAIQGFESDAFTEKQLQEVINASLNALKQIWYHAPFYGNLTRYQFMIRALANKIIEWGVQFVSNGENSGVEVIRTQEIPQMLNKIQFVCKVSDMLIERYSKVSEEIQDEMRRQPLDKDAMDKEKQQRVLEKIVEKLDQEFQVVSYQDKKKRFEQLKKENKILEHDFLEEQPSQTLPEIKYERYTFKKGDRWPAMALVFKRLESFVERIKDIHKLLQIKNAFANLDPDKFEIGGAQGDKLSFQLKKINNLFSEKFEKFQTATYDPTNVGDEHFAEDLSNFMKHYKSLEKRLTAILQTAIESSVQIEQAIVCIEVFSDVLGESILKAIALKQFPLLNQKFKVKLVEVIGQFREQLERPTLEPNMPPQSGKVFWSRLQLNRVRIPHLKLEALYNTYLKGEQDDELYQQNKNLYNVFVTEVTSYEKEIYDEWRKNVNDKCTEKLNEFLLKREQIDIVGLDPKDKLNVDEYGFYTSERKYRYKQGEKELEDSIKIKRNYNLDKPELLQTNFSQELFDILSETKLFKILYKEIPEKAQEVYDKGNEYRSVKNQLDDIVNKYNFAQKQLFYVERPLFYSQLRQIEDLLRDGTHKLTWIHWKENRQEVEDFISRIKAPIEVLYSQVITLKESLKQIEELLKSWAKQSMIERPAKNALVLDKVIPQIQNKVQQFKRDNLTKIKQQRDGMTWEVDVDKITTNISRAKNVVFLKEVQELYTLPDEAKKVAEQIVLSKEDEEQLKNYWEFYQLFYSEYLQTGLLEIIIANIKQIQKYMDESETPEHNDFYQKNITPSEQSYSFIEVSMNIQHQQLLFDPGCDPTVVNPQVDSLESVIRKWIGEISKITNIVFNPVAASTVESLRSCQMNNYLVRIQENERYKKAVEELTTRVNRRAALANVEQKIVLPYQDLFTTDKKVYIQRFLADGPNVPLSGDYDVSQNKEEKVTRTIVMKAQQDKDDQKEEEGEDDGKPKAKAQEDDGMDAGQVVQEEQTVMHWRKPDIHDFNEVIDKYERLNETIQTHVPNVIRLGWLQVKVTPARTFLLEESNTFRDLFMNNRVDEVKNKLIWLQQIIGEARKTLNTDFSSENFEKAMKTLQEIKVQAQNIDNMFEPIKQICQMLQRHGKTLEASVFALFESLPKQWADVKAIAMSAKEKLAPLQQQELQKLNEGIRQFSNKVIAFRDIFQKQEAPFKYNVGLDNAYQMMDRAIVKLNSYRENANELIQRQGLFEQQFQDKSLQNDEIQQINQMEKELKLLKGIWDLADVVETQVKEWKKSLFQDVNTDSLQDTISKLTKQLVKMDQISRAYPVYKELDQILKNFLNTIPLITNLRDKSMRERHWQELMKKTQVKFVIDENFKLADLLDLNLHLYQEDVAEIVDCARKELVQEVQLENLKNVWKNLGFVFVSATDPTQTALNSDQIQQMLVKGDMFNVVVPEELSTQLEQDQMIVSAMAGNQTVQFFTQEVTDWQRKLSTLDSIIQTWLAVQRTWSYLKPIFKFSEDIRRQLPDDTKRFEIIDQSWTSEMNKAVLTPNALIVAEHKEFLNTLERDQKNLVKCEKALSDYLDTKRRIFPRFYFVSSVDLLDILSKGQQPRLVEKHLSKIFDNIHTLKWENPDDMECKTAVSFCSGEKEEVPFSQNFKCVGQVENWLNDLVTQTRFTLKQALSRALNSYIADESKADWLEKTYAQICIVALQIQWTSETQSAFDKMAENNEGAMKEYNKKQNDALMSYIQMIQGNLKSIMRTKMAAICTIEVHAKDIVAGLIRDKVVNQQSFAWQSQLKFYWDEKLQDCVIKICDADFQYSYEYLGCQSRLVITPLTDRCYITLTQSLHLNLGGAPAGPAGTGKTETTKDLGRALGRMVYVFNCSPEMDYKSLGNIFYGLSLSGSWGCFDEFNRISIEVLSVVAMQVKSVLDAIRAKKEYFSLEGEDDDKPNMPKAKLNRQVGYFITMNPGYAGRTELPDNLKALFRGVAMVVPDFCQITEITLISNGFMGARELAKKFTTLYSLNRELLSKQDHYDWGLRAVIAICRTAGTLRRSMIKRPEELKK
ncbi:Dynein_heavy chain [Hexamita inflata]|uniref:Dynein heavy chain n=1 Tax=Hexamita inflata TaxID=28002 RepID=A0AA86N811_9EUKA|nr:Dynein heavy chain [Hexamita inflata]